MTGFDTITFQPGETSKKISVSIVSDDIEEADDQFSVVLSNPTNATVAKNAGVATLKNDDSKALFTNSGYDAPTAYPGYTLAWRDEFNGTTLDPATWTFETGTGGGGWGNNELEYYTDRSQNASLQDGKLVIHEEIPQRIGRAYSRQDALQLLKEVKELNGNMVRLAHYPHNENMTRMADSIGILVWSEIPVYWTIDFGNADVLEKAKGQLKEMIDRDHNRASVIIWSVGNETPINNTRTNFMKELVATARKLDNARLISAALESHTENNVHIIDDPLGEFVDLVSVNEYLGWYGGLPSDCRSATCFFIETI